MHQIRHVATTVLAAPLLVAVLAVGAPAHAADRYTTATRVVAAVAPLSVDAAVDADGFLHIAYLDDHEPKGLTYATDRGGWHKVLVRADVGFEAQPSIALDADGYAFIAYARIECPDEVGGICDDPEDEPISRIHVATNRTGAWTSRVRSAGLADLWPSLAFSGGHLHIAFKRQLWPPGHVDSGVWYLTNDGGWHESQVASGRWRCFRDQIPSIAVSAGGRVWIAYEAARKPSDGCGGTAGIRVAERLGDGAWHRETLTTDRDDVQPVLALDAARRPGLVFDRSGEGVRFTRRLGGDWTALRNVSSGGEADLVFDAASRAHVAVESHGIQVAVWSGSGFARTQVYSGPVDYGTYGGPAIVLAPDSGLARIVFGRSESDDTPVEDELGVYLVKERP